MNRIATGGRPLAGATIGILMLDARIPRIPGDTGNALTWSFPVLYKVVTSATPTKVVNDRAAGLKEGFLEAAAELVRLGADGIATTGGFLSIFQQDLADHTGVPVASSSLMQIPLAQMLLPKGKRVGVLTIEGKRLGPDHLVAAGAPADTPIVGTEDGQELTRKFLANESEVDFALVEQDMLMAGRKMLAGHPDVGAFVLECHNMAPYSQALRRAFGIPVFDVHSFITWFHLGLDPKNFGWPGSTVPVQGASRWQG